MNLEELLRKRLVEKTERDAKAADSLLLNAERDLKVAEGNLKMGNSDWALAIAYNAMLSSGRALMAREGYRATSESHHFAVVQFCATFLPEKTSGLANAFNRYRVRRHDVVYGESDSVGEDEAKKAIESAKRFLAAIREIK